MNPSVEFRRAAWGFTTMQPNRRCGRCWRESDAGRTCRSSSSSDMPGARGRRIALARRSAIACGIPRKLGARGTERHAGDRGRSTLHGAGQGGAQAHPRRFCGIRQAGQQNWASTAFRSMPRMAISCTISSRRSPTSAPTNMAAALPIACVSRWRSMRRCARSSRPKNP